MKHTIASLSALVTNLQGQIKHAEQRIEKLERRSKAAAVAYLKSQDLSAVGSIELPSNFDTMTPEAQQRVRESLARRNALRNKQQSAAMQH